MRKSKVPTSASRVVLSWMQLTRHATRQTPHGTSSVVHAMHAWSVKTPHTPSPNRRDARVYDPKDSGHALYDYLTPLPSTLR